MPKPATTHFFSLQNAFPPTHTARVTRTSLVPSSLCWTQHSWYVPCISGPQALLLRESCTWKCRGRTYLLECGSGRSRRDPVDFCFDSNHAGTFLSSILLRKGHEGGLRGKRTRGWFKPRQEDQRDRTQLKGRQVGGLV